MNIKTERRTDFGVRNDASTECFSNDFCSRRLWPAVDASMCLTSDF